MRIVLPVIIAAMSSALIPSCGDSSSTRSHPVVNPSAATPGTRDQQPVGSDGSPTPKSSPVGSVNDGSKPTSTSGLAPYLYDLVGAKKITPLVEVFKASTQTAPPPAHNPKFNTQRDLIANFLNVGLTSPKLAPGRTFTVNIFDDPEFQALSADLQVVAYTGFLNKAGALSAAVVLCHESAHSTRNHSTKTEPLLAAKLSTANPKFQQFDQTMNKFITDHFDQKNKVYHQRRQDYLAVKKVWEEFWFDFWQESKRIESEADIVGAQICAEFGFTPEEILQGASETFTATAAGDAEIPADGDYQYKGEVVDFLQGILGGDTHPSNDERRAQFSRIAPLLKVNAAGTVAATWKKSYPSRPVTLVNGDHHGPGCNHVAVQMRHALDLTIGAARAD